MNMLLKQIYFSALVASLATPTEVYGQMPKRGVLGAVEKDKKTDGDG